MREIKKWILIISSFDMLKFCAQANSCKHLTYGKVSSTMISWLNRKKRTAEKHDLSVLSQWREKEAIVVEI